MGFYFYLILSCLNWTEVVCYRPATEPYTITPSPDDHTSAVLPNGKTLTSIFMINFSLYFYDILLLG